MSSTQQNIEKQNNSKQDQTSNLNENTESTIPICVECKSNPTHFYCPVEKLHLCYDCNLKYHPTEFIYKKHQVHFFELENQRNQLCKLHHEKCTKYCKVHDKLICSTCETATCSTHQNSLLTFEQATEEFFSFMRKSYEEINILKMQSNQNQKAYHLKMQNMLEEMSKFKSIIKKNKLLLISEIENTYSFFIQLINKFSFLISNKLGKSIFFDSNLINQTNLTLINFKKMKDSILKNNFKDIVYYWLKIMKNQKELNPLLSSIRNQIQLKNTKMYLNNHNINYSEFLINKKIQIKLKFLKRKSFQKIKSLLESGLRIQLKTPNKETIQILNNFVLMDQKQINEDLDSDSDTDFNIDYDPNFDFFLTFDSKDDNIDEEIKGKEEKVDEKESEIEKEEIEKEEIEKEGIQKDNEQKPVENKEMEEKEIENQDNQQKEEENKNEKEKEKEINEQKDNEQKPQENKEMEEKKIENQDNHQKGGKNQEKESEIEKEGIQKYNEQKDNEQKPEENKENEENENKEENDNKEEENKNETQSNKVKEKEIENEDNQQKEEKKQEIEKEIEREKKKEVENEEVEKNQEEKENVKGKDEDKVEEEEKEKVEEEEKEKEKEKEKEEEEEKEKEKEKEKEGKTLKNIESKSEKDSEKDSRSESESGSDQVLVSEMPKNQLDFDENIEIYTLDFNPKVVGNYEIVSIILGNEIKKLNKRFKIVDKFEEFDENSKWESKYYELTLFNQNRGIQGKWGKMGGGKIYTEGFHEIKFKINNFAMENSWSESEICIGLIDYEKKDEFFEKYQSWDRTFSFETRWNSNNSGKFESKIVKYDQQFVEQKYGSPFKTGDYVSIYLDMFQKNVSFGINNQNFGIAWGNIPERVCFFISFYSLDLEENFEISLI
ncbi:optomotor-blind-related-gene-1 isoform a-related [Anaeramoeba flamelloides]|uniref:Optomotor-blind-related-gene-1 isoform a-related n=1 Tax=Anaeramoeba flamelloides TaxID=1746091 RepID=A0AAV8A5R4_9EUKA|nr:optomotor-blind-related-gene-1 isoform a-related [Anaeramoeba flamelloides]